MLKNKPSYTQSQNLPVSYVYLTAHKSDNINLPRNTHPSFQAKSAASSALNRPNLLSFCQSTLCCIRLGSFPFVVIKDNN